MEHLDTKMVSQQYSNHFAANPSFFTEEYDEGTSNDVFIDKVYSSFRYSPGRRMASKRQADFSDMAFYAENMMSITKNTGFTTRNTHNIYKKGRPNQRERREAHCSANIVKSDITATTLWSSQPLSKSQQLSHVHAPEI